MRALVVAVLSAGCSAPAAPPREPAKPVLASGDLVYQLPSGWSEKLRVSPIANRADGSITAEFQAVWKTLVTPSHEVAPPAAPYRRRLASGYALAYDHAASVSLYLIYTDDRYVAIVATGMTVDAEPALAKLFDAMTIRGVPPSKTPLFDIKEIANHWSTLSVAVATRKSDPGPPNNLPGEEFLLEPKGHFESYVIGVRPSTGALFRDSQSGLWRIEDDVLATENNSHGIDRRRIWASGSDALNLTNEGTAQPRLFDPNDTINSVWFKLL
jgi:hypothetical protein